MAVQNRLRDMQMAHAAPLADQFERARVEVYDAAERDRDAGNHRALGGAVVKDDAVDFLGRSRQLIAGPLVQGPDPEGAIQWYVDLQDIGVGAVRAHLDGLAEEVGRLALSSRC